MLNKGNVLTQKGTLTEEGYSFEEVKRYNKENIPSLYSARLKEWDYYSFLNDEMGFLLTVANNTYMSYISCSFVDFVNKEYVTKTYLNAGSNHINLPHSPLKGNINISDKRFYISIKKETNSTKILAKLNHFVKKMDLVLNFDVTNKNLGNSLFILHPFKNKHHFYYNFKENLLIANGYIKLGDNKTPFKGDGVYDWGRGVWPYSTEWYWISTSKTKENSSLGFNLGNGFGIGKDSENIVYFDNEKFKLDDLIINIPKTEKGKISYLENWELKSKNGYINLTFTPLVNRHDSLNFGLLSTTQNQVFGHFNGQIKTKEKVLTFTNELGFIEHFKNRW